ncbi:MAG TPA: helix-turn-helix domain-containing protein [Myxococcota bacterium]|nr:helix-turn-helix domain-containing protein [Myxococcota bacterium]
MSDTAPARSAATAHGELSRERILAAAIALFSERGFAGTSVADVCERAGVVKTALYWHFESKEGLLDAALARVAEAWIAEIRANVEEVTGIEARLERFMAGLRALVTERSETLLLILGAVLERAEVNETTRANLHELFQSARGAIAEVVRETLGRDVPDLDLAADAALSLVHGIAIAQRLTRDPALLERQFAYLKRIFALAVLDAAKALGGPP